MKLQRFAYDANALIDFYEQGLTALGALCERTWHDRLEVVAEQRAAALWNANGSLHSGELHFAAADTGGARDAAREVFPGCPLTFNLTEALRSSPLALERIELADDSGARAPEPAVAEKLWRNQFPDSKRWKLLSPFNADFHFSLLALIRAEVQAIDQHWSLHRIAVSLPDGERDEHLAREIGFARTNKSPSNISWPLPDPAQWAALFRTALEQELAQDLGGIRARQENSLRRDLDRVDDYFENYERELSMRVSRSTSENAKIKISERLAAARAEHSRRRSDQVARHEIRVRTHFDALLLVAEPAWRTSLEVDRAHQMQTVNALLVPRTRTWVVAERLVQQ